MKKVLKLFITLILIILISNTTAHADAFRKLGRGLMNSLTGWTEVFFTVNKAFRDGDNDVPRGLSALPTGIVKAGIRTLVGVYEIATFPLPIPKNYEPIVLPEFVLTREDPYEDVYTGNKGPYN